MSRVPRGRPSRSVAADPARDAWALVVSLVKAARSRYLAELDLTPAQAQLLMQIDVGGPMPMSELANGLGCDASNVTGLVDRLEGRKLIERRPAAADRRVKLVAMTPTGARMQRQLRDRWFEPPAQIAALSAKDQAALLAILKRASA